jgi:protein transport protein SEC61 subunit gamma-like protein
MEQNMVTGIISKTKRFIRECVRVLKVTRKPDMVEFKGIVKISALGIAIIGAIGFAIFMTYTLIRQA